MSNEAQQILRKRLAPKVLVTDPAILETYRGDWMVPSLPGAEPLGLARPENTQEVSEILSLCNELSIPVVPQGGRTGLAGGAALLPGSVGISLENMSRVETVDVTAATMTLEAGVTMKAAQLAAEEAGLLFPLDTGSRDSCMIGGNLATNAGGNRVLKYGMARDLVLGLEVVLADGTVMSSMNTMLKNNAGYDLKQLFIGSEGTLGVITRAVLRLYDAPLHRDTALCAAPDFDAVREVVRRVRKALGTDLSAFEAMWPEFYGFATNHALKPPLDHGLGYYLLIEQERRSDEAMHFEEILAYCIEDGLLVDVLIAQSSREAETFWAIRDASGDLQTRFWPNANFDVSIPITRIDGFVSSLRGRLEARWSDAKLIVFGHVVDSNIHLAVQVREDPFPQAEIDLVVYDCVGEFGGSISAEHGIGTLKTGYLDRSRSPVEINMMQQIKKVLDPGGILNPGKVFPLPGAVA